MAVGRVIRFDGLRGYGFIAPDHGGEDVFLHVNELLIPESSVCSGLAVEFEVEAGDRGLKASGIRLAHGADEGDRPAPVAVSGPRTSAAPVVRMADPPSSEGPEPTCDVLGSAEYTRELTELLLASVPELTARQILVIRDQLALFGKRHGWIED